MSDWSISKQRPGQWVEPLARRSTVGHSVCSEFQSATLPRGFHSSCSCREVSTDMSTFWQWHHTSVCLGSCSDLVKRWAAWAVGSVVTSSSLDRGASVFKPNLVFWLMRLTRHHDIFLFFHHRDMLPASCFCNKRNVRVTASVLLALTNVWTHSVRTLRTISAWNHELTGASFYFAVDDSFCRKCSTDAEMTQGVHQARQSSAVHG